MTRRIEQRGARRSFRQFAGKLGASAFARFLVAGGSTTLVSYLLYLALLQQLGHQLAYAAGFIVGVVWSYSVNALLVFQVPWRWSKLVQYPLVYLVQYAIAALLLQILVEWLGVSPVAAPLVIVVLTVPLTFLLSRRIVLERSGRETQSPDPDYEHDHEK